MHHLAFGSSLIGRQLPFSVANWSTSVSGGSHKRTGTRGDRFTLATQRSPCEFARRRRISRGRQGEPVTPSRVIVRLFAGERERHVRTGSKTASRSPFSRKTAKPARTMVDASQAWPPRK